MHPNSRLKSAVKALLVHLRSDLNPSIATLSLATAMLTVAGQVQAQDMEFNIPAQALDTALQAFGKQTGLQMLYSPDSIEGLRSNGVRGQLSFDAAVEQLLRGTRLAYEISGSTVTLRQAPQTLRKIRVEDDAEQSEGTGSYTTQSMSAAIGLSLSPRETPQSVSVLTREQMDDFNLRTLQDVAKATPGLYTKMTGVSIEESSFYARGFNIGYLSVDGSPLSISNYNSYNVSADLVMYDRVEVVRGATGLLQGAGDPSASINLVRKRPTAQPLLNLSADIGSWNYKQISIDAGHALNQAGTVRARVVGAWRDSDSFVDVTGTENRTIYGILETDLGSATVLSAGGSVQRNRTDGAFTGLPTYPDGRHIGLSRSTYLGTPDSFRDTDTDTVFVELEHKFANDWTFKAVATHIDAQLNSRFTNNSRIANSETTVRQSENGWNYKTKQNVVDLRVQGPVQWFGREHELLIGASYRDDEINAQQRWGGGGGRVVDIYAWDPNAYRLTGALPASPLGNAWDTQEEGLYAAGKFHVAEPLRVIVGGRLDWYTQDITGWYTGTPSWTRSLEEKAEFVPYAGAVYDVGRNHSVYASVTEVFTPQSVFDVNGNTLDPITGTNYEAGFKGEYFDGALNTSAAIFRIKQRNRSIRDSANCPSGGAVECYRAAGEVEGNGFELQISGAVLPGWQVSAGYTHVRTKYTKDANPSIIGKRISTDEPENLFKFYTSYQLPGRFNQWNIHGAVQAQSKFYNAEEPDYYTSQGGYAVVDAGVGYDANERLHLQLNVANVLDKTYYTTLGYSWTASYEQYGAPRSFMLTAKYSFAQ